MPLRFTRALVGALCLSLFLAGCATAGPRAGSRAAVAERIAANRTALRDQARADSLAITRGERPAPAPELAAGTSGVATTTAPSRTAASSSGRTDAERDAQMDRIEHNSRQTAVATTVTAVLAVVGVVVAVVGGIYVATLDNP